MAVNYRQYLDKNWGAGATSNAARAAAFRRQTQNVGSVQAQPPKLSGTTGSTFNGQPAATLAPPTTQPARPSFTPGALDEQGSRYKGDRDFQHQMTMRGYDQEYNDTDAEIKAQGQMLQKQRDDNYRNVDNNASGRGMGRSGIRVQNRTNVAADYDMGQQDLGRQALRAANRRQQQKDMELGQYNLDSTNNTIDSNVRLKQQWDDNNPVTVPEPAAPAAAAKKTPAVPYKTWLKGRTSTAATAAAWRKAMGM